MRFTLMTAGGGALSVRGGRTAAKTMFREARGDFRTGRHVEMRVRRGKRAATIAHNFRGNGWNVMKERSGRSGITSRVKNVRSLKSAVRHAVKFTMGKRGSTVRGRSARLSVVRGSGPIRVRAHTIHRGGKSVNVKAFTRKRRGA